MRSGPKPVTAGRLGAGHGRRPAEVADSLYINGNIYTVDEDFSTATTMAVKGDRILYVGDQAGAEAYVGAGTEITDLGGKTVLPGLIEGHMHVSNLGENHLKLDCYFKSKEDILEMVRQAAKEAEPASGSRVPAGWIPCGMSPASLQRRNWTPWRQQPGLSAPGRQPYGLV